MTLLVTLEELVKQYNEKEDGERQAWLDNLVLQFSQNAPACYLGKCRVLYELLMNTALIFNSQETLAANMTKFMKDYLKRVALRFWEQRKDALQDPANWSVCADFMKFREQHLYKNVIKEIMMLAYPPFLKAFYEQKPIMASDVELSAENYAHYFRLNDGEHFDFFALPETDNDYASITAIDVGLPDDVCEAFERMEAYMRDVVYKKIIPTLEGDLWKRPFSRVEEAGRQEHIVSYYYAYIIGEVLAWLASRPDGGSEDDIAALRRQLTIENMVQRLNERRADRGAGVNPVAQLLGALFGMDVGTIGAGGDIPPQAITHLKGKIFPVGFDDRQPLPLRILYDVIPQDHRAHAMVEKLLSHDILGTWASLINLAAEGQSSEASVFVVYLHETKPKIVNNNLSRLNTRNIKEIKFTTKLEMVQAMQVVLSAPKLLHKHKDWLLHAKISNLEDGSVFQFTVREDGVVEVKDRTPLSKDVQKRDLPLYYQGQKLTQLHKTDAAAGAEAYQQVLALLPRA